MPTHGSLTIKHLKSRPIRLGKVWAHGEGTIVTICECLQIRDTIMEEVGDDGDEGKRGKLVCEGGSKGVAQLGSVGLPSVKVVR